MRKSELVSGLVDQVIRLHGPLTASINAQTRPGLSIARLQLLREISEAKAPLTVAHIAHILGAARQSVQSLANEMAREHLLRFDTNPRDRRAELVVLTLSGEKAYKAAMRKLDQWMEALARRLGSEEIKAATRTLESVRRALETM